MAQVADPLLRALREPASMLRLDAAAWNDLIGCARRHSLLARLAIAVEESGLEDKVPAKVREQFADARAAAELNQTIRRFDTRELLRALDGMRVPIVLLKGGAYLLAKLPAARGRMFADLDILVPRERLAEVEAAVLAHGWEPVVTGSYDQHYYRTWTHQIPPLRHGDRGSELDIHHTIAPLTSRAAPDVDALLTDAIALADTRLRILAPADMVLHAAVHLFNEEMVMGLRDLLDLHDLLSHFGQRDGFWPELGARARRHGLERPLFYCLRYAERFYGTSIPASARAQVDAFGPNRAVRALMDRLVSSAVLPAWPGRRRPGAGIARWLLYVRSHWLRMPPGLLARHLLVKALIRARRGLTTHAVSQP